MKFTTSTARAVDRSQLDRNALFIGVLSVWPATWKLRFGQRLQHLGHLPSASLPSGLRSVLPGIEQDLVAEADDHPVLTDLDLQLARVGEWLELRHQLAELRGARLRLRLRLPQLLHALLRLFQLAAQVAALGLEARHILAQRLELLGQHIDALVARVDVRPVGAPSPCPGRPASRPASASARRDPSAPRCALARRRRSRCRSSPTVTTIIAASQVSVLVIAFLLYRGAGRPAESRDVPHVPLNTRSTIASSAPASSGVLARRESPRPRFAAEPRARLVLCVAEAVQQRRPLFQLAAVHRLAARLFDLARASGFRRESIQSNGAFDMGRYFNPSARFAACQSRSCSSAEASPTARPSAAERQLDVTESCREAIGRAAQRLLGVQPQLARQVRRSRTARRPARAASPRDRRRGAPRRTRAAPRRSSRAGLRRRASRSRPRPPSPRRASRAAAPGALRGCRAARRACPSRPSPPPSAWPSSPARRPRPCATTSPKTCGWRRTSLATMPRATSSMPNFPSAKRSSDWKTICSSRSPSSSR